MKKKSIAHRMSNSSEYHTWGAMIQRCENPNNHAYKHYGGRGITICAEWHSFLAFFKNMGKRPPGLTLERKDNNLGYYPSNCVWASWEVQINNQQPLSYDPSGQRWFVAGHIVSRKILKSNNRDKFAKEHNLLRSGIYNCLRKKTNSYKGWKFKWAT